MWFAGWWRGCGVPVWFPGWWCGWGVAVWFAGWWCGCGVPVWFPGWLLVWRAGRLPVRSQLTACRLPGRSEGGWPA